MKLRSGYALFIILATLCLAKHSVFIHLRNHMINLSLSILIPKTFREKNCYVVYVFIFEYPTLMKQLLTLFIYYIWHLFDEVSDDLLLISKLHYGGPPGKLVYPQKTSVWCYLEILDYNTNSKQP